LVVIHELGHYVTARLFGIKVLEFGIGYPPKLFGIKRGETVYSINLLPLGGFVKLLGEEDPSDPRSLASRKPWQRFIVLISGAFMNFILPLFVFIALAMVPQKNINGQVQIQSVAAESPAERAGLKPGDIVLKIDGHEIKNTQDLSYRVRLRLGAETTWEVLRQKQALTAPIGVGREPGLTPTLPPVSSETLVMRIVPRWRPPAGQGATGISIANANAQIVTERSSFFTAVPGAFVRMGETLVLFKNEIESWIIRATSPQLAGPIGIAQMTGEVARAGGWTAVLGFAALLSLNLAVLNVLPIPMLDGGRIVFVVLEWVRRGKRISPQKENLVHVVGMVVLLLAVVVVSYFDIARILSGESLVR
jgi:regulator of sigma E protease